MISTTRFLLLASLLLTAMTALPRIAGAQSLPSSADALAPPMAAQAPLSLSAPGEFQLSLPDTPPVDRGLVRARRFRRAGAVFAGAGGLLLVGGLIGLATYHDSCADRADFCIDFGPLGSIFTIAAGVGVLANALILYGIGRAIDAHSRTSLRASVDRHGGSVGLDLRF